jgi:hypothetical protein
VRLAVVPRSRYTDSWVQEQSRKTKESEKMKTGINDYPSGSTFTLHIPVDGTTNPPYFIAKCVIASHTDDELCIAFTVEDWLETTFCVPVPEYLDTLMCSIYLRMQEIIKNERIEFLCSMLTFSG